MKGLDAEEGLPPDARPGGEYAQRARTMLADPRDQSREDDLRDDAPRGRGIR